jgi:hemolysin-activating ACP:hemolysin acyltransferase
MFFRSKNEKERAEPVPSTVQPAKLEPPPEKVAGPPTHAGAPNAGTTRGVAAAANADRALPPEELKKRAEISQQLAATIGEIVGLMIRSPRHHNRTVSDLRWLVLPPVRTGQCALVQAQSKANGLTAPVAAVLWASVSAEVDKRLSEKLDEPVRLAPREWKSGDILWLVDAIGDDRAIAAVVQRLRVKEWKDKPVKARVTAENGEVRVRLIEPRAASNGATGPQQPAG